MYSLKYINNNTWEVRKNGRAVFVGSYEECYAFKINNSNK